MESPVIGPLGSDSLLPIAIEGWVVLALSLLITLIWLLYLYR